MKPAAPAIVKATVASRTKNLTVNTLNKAKEISKGLGFKNNKELVY